MPVRIVESRQNARLKELRRALSGLARGASGLVGIEGPNLLEEALRAGLRIATVFVGQGSERLLGSLSLQSETEILRVPRSLLASALATETPQPIAALIEPPNWSWAQLVDLGQINPRQIGPGKNTALLVILAGLQDPGNVGTILRSAEAFGATGVVSLPGTVSAWNPKTVRASAGSVFRIPFLASKTEECFARLRENKVKILATAIQEAKPADRVNLRAPVAILIGNEGNGLRKELAAQADGTITVPCPGPVESLNAAMAATVLLYEAARQRRGAR